jgi:capsular polysaccharide biosynthesis protein
MRRFVAAYFRHPFTLILPAILIPVIVVFAVRSLASSYQSSATIYVGNSYVTLPSSSGSPFLSPAQNLGSSINDYLKSRSFVLGMAEQTDMPKTYAKGTGGVADLMVARIIAGLSLTAVGSRTLSVTYTDTNPRVAAQVINALINQYKIRVVQDAQTQADQTVQFYQQQLQQDQAALATANEQLQSYTQSHPNVDINDPALAQLNSNYQLALQQVQSDISTIQKVQDKSQLVIGLTSFEVTDPPLVPTSPTIKSKTTITAVVGGVALGLGISLGLIGLMAVADRRVYAREDLAEAMPIPVLEVLPRLRGLNETMIGGSEENLLQLAKVPVLATVPQLTGGSALEDNNQTLSGRAEDQ